MRTSIRRSSPKCLSSRVRASSSSSSDKDETTRNEDSSAHCRQPKNNSAAKKQRDKGERKKEESDELRGGSDERNQDEVNNDGEILGMGSGMRTFKKEPNDGEMGRPSRIDGMKSRKSSSGRNELMNMVPAHSKRRSQKPQRFNIIASTQPRSNGTRISSEERKKNQQQKLLYQRLTGKSKRLGLNHSKKEFKKKAENDQDMTIVDPKIDIEVYEKGPRENADIWDAKAEETGGNEWQIDYLVATEQRSLGENLKNETRVMIKWTEYPHPTWEPIKQLQNFGAMVREFEVRTADLDNIANHLRSTLGDAEFERRFPNRYLKKEDGYGMYGYVTNNRSLYINKLRAIESRWTFINDRAGLPPVYIEDWTDQVEDDQSLKELDYVNYLLMTPEAKRKVTAMENQLDFIRCEAGCCGCVGKKKDDHKSCCYARRKEIAEDYVRVECTSACGCDNSCKNRIVQNGRQLRLCVFREPNKGWGARVMREVKNNTFIEEYTGEIGLKPGNFIYDFPVSFPATERHLSGKKLFSLINRAGEKGNVARFFNHSCDPNLHADNVLIERHGRFYIHIGFFTARKINAGEELTFKYFQGNVRKMNAMLPNGCKCGAKNCLVSVPTQGQDEEEEEDEEDEEDEEEEEEDNVEEEEVDDGMQPHVENEDMERPSLRRARSTNQSMTEMEEQRGRGRPRKGPSAHSGLTDDESEGENRVTIRRHPSGIRIDQSMDENPFSSPSREEVEEGGMESGRAKGRGSARQKKEPQSQEEVERKKADTVVRKGRGRKEGTVVKKTRKAQEVKAEPKMDVIDVSSDDEDEKERLREIWREKMEKNGMGRVVTRGELRKSRLEEREKKNLKNINREQASPIPMGHQPTVASVARAGARRGVKRELEDHGEDGTEVGASTSKMRPGLVKIEMD